MDTKNLLKEVRKEISRLEQVAALLGGSQATSSRGSKGKSERAPMSQSARKKIAAAQRLRWKKVRDAKAAKS